MSTHRNLAAVLVTATIIAACSGRSEQFIVVANGDGGSAGSLAGAGRASSDGFSGAGPLTTGGAGGFMPGSGGSTSGGAGFGGGPLFQTSVAVWRSDAKGVYSLIHDDFCFRRSVIEGGVVTTLLDSRGLKAAFGADPDLCEQQWDIVRQFASSGHEIVNNDSPYADFKKSLGSDAVRFYVFRFGLSDDSKLKLIKDRGYLGARAGKHGAINPPDFPDDFRLSYDTFGPGFSAYCDDGPCASEKLVCCEVNAAACATGDGAIAAENQGSASCRVSVLNAYVDDAIAGRGWAIRRLGGLDKDGWEAVERQIYEQHLDYLQAKAKAGELWVDTPTTVLKYRRARDFCKTTLDGNVLRFGTPSAECSKYAVPLTIVVRASDSVAGLIAMQKGTQLSVRSIASGAFLVDVDPLAGDVTLAAK